MMHLPITGVVGAVTPPPSVYVLDTFTDTTTTPIASHTPDVDVEGGGWSVLSGTGWTIVSNRLECSSTSAAHVQIDSGVADCVLTYDHTFADTTDGRISGGLVRITDVQNAWMVGVQSPNNGSPTLVINEITANVQTLRAFVVMTGQGSLVGETWPFTVTLSGNSITIATTINGTPYSINYSSSVRAGVTVHGLRNRNLDKFDNFQVAP